jgi:hypothetical protein
LKPTNAPLNTNTQKAGNTDAKTIRNTRRTKRKLTITHLPLPPSSHRQRGRPSLGFILKDGAESIDIDGATDETFIEDDAEDEIDGGNEGEESVEGQNEEIEGLEEGDGEEGA